MERVSRLLALLSCLTLVLPQGWCCILAVKAAAHPVTAAKDAKQGCCPCQPSPGQPADTPAPVKHCPCEDRNATPPTPQPDATDDAQFSAFVPEAFELTSSPASEVEEVGRPLPPRSARLHVWNCVWLC